MRLFDVLKSLIGERDVAVGSQEGFASSADSAGQFLSSVRRSKRCRGKGNALQKIQLIVLNMLSEQGIAEHTANGFHIGAEDIAGMDSERGRYSAAATAVHGALSDFHQRAHR